MNFFNKASKLLNNYFKYDPKIDEEENYNIEDSLIYLNSQLVLWKENKNFDLDSFNQLFLHRFEKKFMIYNLTDHSIDFKGNDGNERVIDFKTPSYPAYSLEFLLSFAISAKNWLSLDTYNVLIVYDDFKNVRKLFIPSRKCWFYSPRYYRTLTGLLYTRWTFMRILYQ
jgi:hypothetical protein